MTPTNKCQHDGEMKTGWDELTCKKCFWILPSGQRIGIHFGWFPSHEAHKEFKKYRTYTGMDNTYPIDTTKSAEVQNMTQNNEHLDITPLEQINAVQSIRNAETLDDALRVMNGLAANGWLRLWDNATHPDGSSYRDKSPISQNEQQEVVAYTDGKGDFITKETYDEYLKLGFYTKCNVPLYNSPHKQIPDGWKLVPIEPNTNMLEAVKREKGDHSSFEEWVEYGYVEDAIAEYKAMINAAPTTSETNTEVGE